MSAAPSTMSPVADLAACLRDGMKVAVPKDAVGAPMALTREIVRRGLRGLHLVCVPIGGMQADILIGAGCVSTVETSAVTLDEYGTGPRFAAALRSGSIRVLDSTCPAIHAGLQAAQKGLPFIPLRGLVGSDLLKHRSDWKVIDNPFADRPDPIVLLSAIRPDVTLAHALRADRNGNVFIGRQRELLTMAQASGSALFTVESLTDEDLMADPDRSPGVVPALYVSGIALAPGGAQPLRFLDEYAADEAALAEYARLARTEEGFRGWLGRWLGTPGQAAA